VREVAATLAERQPHANLSPLRSPSLFKPWCRPKAARNHDPRVRQPWAGISGEGPHLGVTRSSQHPDRPFRASRPDPGDVSDDLDRPDRVEGLVDVDRKLVSRRAEPVLPAAPGTASGSPTCHGRQRRRVAGGSEQTPGCIGYQSRPRYPIAAQKIANSSYSLAWRPTNEPAVYQGFRLG
jgi:hypothetical protein